MHDPSVHLFIDDHHIRNAFALKRKFFPLEQDHKPILTDIEGRMVCWASVMHDGGKFRCWYLSLAPVDTKELIQAGVYGKGTDFGYYPQRHPNSIPIHQYEVVSYAESGDGLKWDKPDLGLIEWRGSKKNNICYDSTGAMKQYNGYITNLDGAAVVKDESAEPAKRYKMISHWESLHCWDNEVSKLGRPKEALDPYWAHRAKYLTTSPDGIHWDPHLTWIKNVDGGDYCGVIRDERNQRWLFHDRPTPALGLGYCRLAGLAISKDLYHWPEHMTQVMHPGEYEEYGKRFEHHGWTPFNYGDQDLGLLELSFSGPGLFSVLCSHRDGQDWEICAHDRVLEIGPKGAADDTLLAATCNPPFVVEDGKRLRFYYNGRHYVRSGEQTSRSGALFAAYMRLDGFAGLVVDDVAIRRYDKPAVLQTQLLPVTQGQLQINIAGHDQTARVALLDESLKAIPGYDVTDCLPIDEDNPRAIVRWKNRASDLTPLGGHDVYILVQLQAGTIYSVRI